MDEKKASEIVKTTTDEIAPIDGEASSLKETFGDDKTVIDLYQAIEILKQQADRIDPYTGKILESNSSYDNIVLSGALFQITEFVKEILPKIPHVKRIINARLRGGRKARFLRKRITRLRLERPPRPDMAGKSWSDEESELLIEQFDKGIGIPELATIHQRTKGAIRSQLKKLGKIET